MAKSITAWVFVSVAIYVLLGLLPFDSRAQNASVRSRDRALEPDEPVAVEPWHDPRVPVRGAVFGCLVVLIVAVGIAVLVTGSFVYAVVGLLLSVCVLPFARTAVDAWHRRRGPAV